MEFTGEYREEELGAAGHLPRRMGQWRACAGVFQTPEQIAPFADESGKGRGTPSDAFNERSATRQSETRERPADERSGDPFGTNRTIC